MKPLIVSFSGGRTSAYMTYHLLQTTPDRSNVHVLFANTGQEDERTLEFVNNCDKFFGFNTTWIEAVPNPQVGKGTDYEVVDYETASRDGKPFERVIAKYGIPNKAYPHCTRELKMNPIIKYVRSLGLKKRTYDMAIGIRADEFDRMSSKAAVEGIVYPLVEWGVTKQDVLDWWLNQPFDLMLPEHRGNCTWCWKKSFRKLFTLANESPEIFDFPKRMEKEYGLSGANRNRETASVFFRSNTSTEHLLTLAKEDFNQYVDTHFLEITNGCSDSCEVFTSSTDGEVA